ncbi:MAG: 6-phosphogluconolactonase [Chloroflexi bacterium]|nr:6-phosphogluconolactonase [Chloroflexota bacterium]
MTAPRLDVFPAADWPERVAAELADRLRERPTARLCLPTGDTPAPVYAALADAAARGAVDLARATVVLLDEYLGLEPSDPARCDARLRRELLDRLPAAPAFHAIAVDDGDPVAAAAAHDAVAAAGLDLTLLGLGANGHVGFNEPGSGPDAATRVVALAETSRELAHVRYGAARTPTGGITLGIARLLASAEIWLLVTGAGKAAVLARTLEGPEGDDCPASFLRRHSRLRVLADEAAATALSGAR